VLAGADETDFTVLGALSPFVFCHYVAGSCLNRSKNIDW
jgi:hypothetical protein